MSSQQIRIPLTREEVEFIDELAEAEGVSFSACVRHLMKLGLDAERREAYDRLVEIAEEIGVDEPPESWTPEMRSVVLHATPKAERLVKLQQLAEQSEGNSVLRS